MKLFVILLFAATYVAMIALPKWRYIVALASAAIMIVSGALPVAKAFGQIDWNVLMMLAGTMGTVSLFIASRMPERMADLLLKKTPNIMWVAVALSVFAGLISAFVDNVATVLMVAPVALAIATKLGTSPVPLLICIAVSSNLQGAATLVGDTTSIMLGGYANMDFLDFLFMDGKCSIFFAVELGALITVPVIMFIFRKEKGKVTVGEPTEVMYEIIEAVEPYMPKDRPRYLMGVGTPSNIIESVARGVDFFDCVMPARNARHGRLFTWSGAVNMKNAKYERDERPIDPECDCPVCRRFSRSYIHHLFKAEEMLAMRLSVMHNLYFYNKLTERIRAALDDGCFADFRAEYSEKLSQKI